jgi:hypothetical protein
MLDDVNTFWAPLTRSRFANRLIPYRRGYLFIGPPGQWSSLPRQARVRPKSLPDDRVPDGLDRLNVYWGNTNREKILRINISKIVYKIRYIEYKLRP